MAEIPNVTLGKAPDTPMAPFMPHRPNPYHAPGQPLRGGAAGKKKKRGSNLMDTGPDDEGVGGGAFAEPSDAPAGAAGRQALSQGIQTQGGVSPAVQQYEQSIATGRQDVGNTGAAPAGAYGFRERPDAAASPYAPPPSPEAPPAPEAQRPARASSALMDTGPDDGGPDHGNLYRVDSQGNYYRAGSASDPYAATRSAGLGFELPSIEGAPFPGVTGAILGGVSGISNRNLDKIQDRAALDPNDPEYDERYTYGEVGNQRFGTSAGFIPGTTVVSGPSELRGLGVNTTVENTPENQQKLLEAQQVKEYQSPSGNTYVGEVAKVKEESDREAQQAGYASAVTDSSGRAVRSGGFNEKGEAIGDIVGAGPKVVQESERVESGESEGGGGGGGK